MPFFRLSRCKQGEVGSSYFCQPCFTNADYHYKISSKGSVIFFWTIADENYKRFAEENVA